MTDHIFPEADRFRPAGGTPVVERKLPAGIACSRAMRRNDSGLKKADTVAFQPPADEQLPGRQEITRMVVQFLAVRVYHLDQMGQQGCHGENVKGGYVRKHRS